MKRQLVTAMTFAYAPALIVMGLLIANPPEQAIDPLPESETYEEGCCADRSPADREAQVVPHRMVWFLDPMDISRANIPAKYKGANYLLFTDGKAVYIFDLTLPGYDSEVEEAKLKEARRGK